MDLLWLKDICGGAFCCEYGETTRAFNVPVIFLTEKRGKPLASDMGKDSAATDQREEAIKPVAGL